MQLKSLIDRERSFDLAEHLPQGLLAHPTVASFDSRSDDELLATARDDVSPVERERALWEYAYRHQRDLGALKIIRDFASSDSEPSIRWNLLWLITKVQGEEAFDVLKDALHDTNPEIQEWAQSHLNEHQDGEPPGEFRRAVYEPEGVFDQTLPLEIAGFADVCLPGGGWVRATLSPLWFNHIMGRVMAAINVDTFMTDLVIEKELENYNPDGSNHYETFLFRGASLAITDDSTQHIYESNTRRRFFESGKLKEGPPVEIPVSLSREALTQRVKPATLEIASREGGSDERGERLKEFGVVGTVRGKFSGWAYTDLERFAKAGEVEPGTVQLTSPTDPLIGHRTNTALHGTFRGKLSDRDGDGILDVNSVRCHGTLKGELDLDCDGVTDDDPFVDQAAQETVAV